jgi:glutathione S-transferase
VRFSVEAGLVYETIAVDTSKEDQDLRFFRVINPDGIISAIVDTGGLGDPDARLRRISSFCLPRQPDN